ncbi:MAG: cryptochrome/photolyase family protein [Gammaproteobacteria bacterium]
MSRDLVFLLGDQLDSSNPALAATQPDHARVLMVETRGEAGHVPSHKQRIAVFLSAMRHRAAALDAAGWHVDYRDLDAGLSSLTAGLEAAVSEARPERVLVTEPGEWRVEHALRSACGRLGVPLEVLPDSHFYCSREDFDEWARGRKQLVMEHFYRKMRKQHGVLMDGDEPAGGRWNYDTENRKSFGRSGPNDLPERPRFEPDRITRGVLDDVERHFPDHPGDLGDFAWPVTPAQASRALEAFVSERLPLFGRYQDAMWSSEPFLYHALVSSSLNLKLLDPREAVEAAETAWRNRDVPLAAAEGFIRQILGWREFIRGVYWRHMPRYAGLNHFGHDLSLPDFFWTGDTPMNCLKQVIGDTLAHGYAHHIQRLMVVGNFALLAGLLPSAVCDWFLAVYVDAVEWVELPNTLGMALHGDGGIVGSKPYAASGAYINRMSNYCSDCRYRPGVRTGEDACPFTFLYWDFLARHREAFAGNPRMALAVKNLERLDGAELGRVRARAAEFRKALTRGGPG